MTIRFRLLAKKALKRVGLEFRFMGWEIIGKLRRFVTISTKQGIFTVSLADNHIGKSLYCYGQHELDLLSEAMKFLRSIHQCPPKGVGAIVDVGANNGVISIGALHTDELEKAIAIEPEPQNFALLQKNVIQNGLEDRIVCLPFAASHKKCTVSFELSGSNPGDHRVRTSSESVDSSPELYHESARQVIQVQSDRLDNVLSKLPETVTRTIVLIWVDVQGYEGYAFIGARKLLSKGIPLVAEIWPYGIKRAGMSQQRFCKIAMSIWSHYCVMRRGKFVRYPINMLEVFFDELGDNGDFDNVIFI